jgi:hypothetical protein
MNRIQDKVLAQHGDLIKRNQEITDLLLTPLLYKEIRELKKEKKKNEVEIRIIDKIIKTQKLTNLNNLSE